MINIKSESLYREKLELEHLSQIRDLNTKRISLDLGVRKQHISLIWDDFLSASPHNLAKLLTNIDVYPQDIPVHTCYYCAKPLFFKTFFKLNSSLPLGKLVDIWNNPSHEYVCAECKQKS